MPTLDNNSNPIINGMHVICREKNTQKILSNVLNQNAYMTKPVRLATFAISTVDNLCFLHQNEWNIIKIRSP